MSTTYEIDSIHHISGIPRALPEAILKKLNKGKVKGFIELDHSIYAYVLWDNECLVFLAHHLGMNPVCKMFINSTTNI